VGVYRTARTLPEGEGDFTLTWSYVRATVEEHDVTTQIDGEKIVVAREPKMSFGFPQVVPELAYHHGVAPNLELGGRLAPTAGLGEIDAKYRFLGGDGVPLHLAVQPTVGYRGLGFLHGLTTSLPLIATYDVTNAVSINSALFGMYTSYDLNGGQDDLDFGGNSVSGGLSGGVQFRAKGGFHLMPSVELQRTLARSGVSASLPDITSTIFAVTMGWGPEPL
jgi:hypothetical protein